MNLKEPFRYLDVRRIPQKKTVGSVLVRAGNSADGR